MFRKANAHDIEEITALYMDIHTEEEAGRMSTGWIRSIYPTRETVESMVASEELFVKIADDRIVAVGRINQEQVDVYANVDWEYKAPDEEVMVLHTLAVLPSQQGKGYAREFCQFYEVYALKHGCRYLRIDTNEKNIRARALYKSIGYREAGIVPCVFNGIEGVPLVCLEKYLGKMRAPLLRQGGTIGICSPSHIADYWDYQNTINCIRSKGFQVKEADNLYKNTYGYAATPEERAADFNQLIADPEVELIIFGGGEGANELLPFIDFENIKRNPKRLCSYSDGTWLLNPIYTKTGLESYYGQAPHNFIDMSWHDEKGFFEHHVYGSAMEQDKISEWKVQWGGQAEGILIGGYARNFALLLGSKYFQPDLNQKYVLFLEDHESFGGVDYISTMISHIEQHDFMKNVVGLIYGNYSDNEHPELLWRLQRVGERHHIPVVYCDDFGHGWRHAIMPLGRQVRLDADQQRLIYL